MRWQYTAKDDAAYITLAEGSPARQVELADGTIVDLDARGAVLGIEILRLMAAGWSPDEVVASCELSPDDTAALELFVRGVRPRPQAGEATETTPVPEPADAPQKRSNTFAVALSPAA